MQAFTRKAGRALAGCACLIALAGCGGGEQSAVTPPPDDCSLSAQQSWLRQYIDDWYLWYADSPRPQASAYFNLQSYFDALLFVGKPPDWPADRFSRIESSEAFDRFYGEGATLGFGVAVAGLELAGRAGQPLFVRHVEMLSPAAAQDIRRGDEVLALNGRSAAEVVAADDYSALSAGAAGDKLTLRLRRGGVERSVELVAAVYTLTPVNGAAVLTSPRGRSLGYVVVKDMISQALPSLDSAFTGFKAAAVDDVVIDLRYNGGGLVSTGGTLASYVAGNRGSGKVYAVLRYNDKRAAAYDQSFEFSSPTAALGLARAIVLIGRRTCSASEQVINGLRGAGVEVLAVGETTCGKPVGFLPTKACGQTFSVVNFESVNQRNEGRYFDGFDATCTVAEDFSVAQGGPQDPLLAAAVELADSGRCPALQATRQSRQRTLRAARGAKPKPEPGEQPGMIPR